MHTGIRDELGSEEHCTKPHLCPNCAVKDGPCMDLFEHPECGLVACATP